MNIMDSQIEKGLPQLPESYWMATTPATDYPELEADMEIEIAIVGGGLVGITVAWLLKKEGIKVAVIDADRIGQGTTGHTTAKITSQHSLIYDRIITKFSREKAMQYASANEAAIRTIAGIIKENHIQCDFQNQPAYVYTHMDEYAKKIEDEVKAANTTGIKAAYLDSIPLPFKVKAAMRFDNQAQFHPRKYLLALAKKIPGDGSHIFENTKAVDLHEGSTCSVITAKGRKISAPHVVLASHYPFYDRHGLYFSRLYPERSYALGVRISDAFPEGMFITAEDPARSFRSQPDEDGEIVIIGGEHHKTGHGENTFNHYEKLRDYSYSIYDVKQITNRWSTQDYNTMDGLPYAGFITSDRHNIFVATGFGKWGMTNSTASAMIIRDLILTGNSPWAPVYDPSRFTPGASAGNFVVENADVAKSLVSGILNTNPPEVDLQPGEGKITEIGGKKVGAYRDEKGKLHLVNTACTHMGCELKWNSAELSWDCPCHGSRFTYEGDIIEGPALKSIKPGIKEEQH